ncbi:aspartyl-phosphate phosphatase Spo0E family protein [Mesobacillus subterraneus]|uniref:Aspartyl-phosphate phosphatase Spo0E family protein n=2 Tax=Mesobacillus subterraneus TaxID=285983 RepID=A0A3R9DLY8_9BACI|nr:aspartyl-phosphate phosphatase Spo0E family protein [Mesobacillus subterraneus]RSD21118.1 aspartyl-phosphate phosphatase Spo0E family protein [Mesobacillus subterraneus]
MKIKKEILLFKIEYSKKELVNIVHLKGFNDPETIRLSQNLDELIVKYQKLLN